MANLQSVMPWKVAPAPAIKPDQTKDLIDELARVRATKSTVEKREKEIAQQLKALGDGLHAGNKVALEIKTSDRDTFQGAAFKEAYPEVYKKFTELKPVTVLTIKPLI